MCRDILIKWPKIYFFANFCQIFACFQQLFHIFLVIFHSHQVRLVLQYLFMMPLSIKLSTLIAIIPQFHFKGSRSKLSEYRKMRANFEIIFSLAHFMLYMARSVPYYGNFPCWIDCNYFWNHMWFMWGDIVIKWQKFGNIFQKYSIFKIFYFFG